MVGDWVKLENKEGAAEAIRRMGEDDLRFLNTIIIERLKLIDQARSTHLMADFGVGDRVTFPGRHGDHKIGTVHRLNKKSATVITDDHQHWTVHPGLLLHFK